MLIRSLACALALTLACGAPVSTPATAPEPTLAFTEGIAPVTALPNAAAPVRAALRGSKLVILARELADARLNLYEFEPARKTFAKIQLDLEDAGAWAGLGVDEAGAIWVGVRNKLFRVDSTGAVDQLALPPVKFPLAADLRLPEPSLPGPNLTGLVTSLAVAGDSIVIGRTDAVELVVLDRATRQFRQLPLPPGVGDVAEVVAGPRNTVIFTVNRSGRVRGLLNDVVGIADTSTGDVRTLPLPARGLSAGHTLIGIGGASITVVDVDGAVTRPPAVADRYDIRRIVLRRDGTVLVRINGSHELAVIDQQGRETARVVYAVPIVKLTRGPMQPYNSSLAYALAAPDNSVWFSLDGRPEVYRIP